ncbi:MAG: hypothetical protein WBO10_10275 [Pyrinomonadaceae bacterium]
MTENITILGQLLRYKSLAYVFKMEPNMPEKQTLKFYLILFSIGFALNLIWEISQMQFFAGKPGNSFLEGVYYCALASVIDGVTIILIYIVASRIINPNNLKFYILTAFFGAFCTIVFENIAFYLKLWSYEESMPIVTLFNVGLLPFVQLTSLVPFSIFIALYLRKIRLRIFNKALRGSSHSY